jgi:hypothetical protein
MFTPKKNYSPKELKELEVYKLAQENKYKNLSPAARAAADRDMNALEKMWLSGDEEADEFLQMLRAQGASPGNWKKYGRQIAEKLSQYNPIYTPIKEQQEVNFGGRVGEAYNRIRSMA